MKQAQPRPKTDPSQSDIVRVLDVQEGALLVTALHGPSSPWKVQCALPPGTRVERGDELVVLHTAQGQVAIARLRSSEEVSEVLRDGTRVHLDAAKTRIQVVRADGTPLFQYSATATQGTITVEHESMSVIASRGDLSLQAAGAIRLQGHSLTAQANGAGASSKLALTPHKLSLASNSMELRAADFELEAGRSRLQGDELHSDHKRAVVRVERLESAMDVVVSTARNVYQSVHELLQQRAGSLRTLVSGTAQLQARDVAQRASESYKIRAEKIHLG